MGSAYPGATGLLGNKTLAMTQRYSHLAPEQLQSAVQTAGWGDWGKAGVGREGSLIEVGSRFEKYGDHSTCSPSVCMRMLAVCSSFISSAADSRP